MLVKMATMEGPLSKWTNVMKGWQYRWFVLDENSGLLSYYTSKEKMMRGARRGCVRLKGAVIGIDDEDDSTFTITVDQKTFHFQARDPEEKEKWIEALENTIVRHSQPLRRWETRPVPSIMDFDRRLVETDAYLQILIDQVQGLEVKIDECPDETAREKYNVIKVTAEAMIESIKQSIVLMQIAKETLQYEDEQEEEGSEELGDMGEQNAQSPLINGPTLNDLPAGQGAVLLEVPTSADQGPSVGEDSSSKSKSVTDMRSSGPEALVNGSASLPLSTSMPNIPITNASVLDSSSVMDSTPALVGKPTVAMSIPAARLSSSRTPVAHTATVPEISYSSSDDEDDFFDAEDGGKADQVNGVEEENEEPRLPPKVIASEDDEFDDLYDDADNDELESLDQHGSIITHLLSQVRIGMDLTKIVLPTFILERRSLLEMYADFLAHPDLFVGIVDQPTPRDRMVQCVRWYLSAFHAGRRSPVAKKPYNPILGEVFQCFYDLPTEEPSKEYAEDGPIPWASKNNVSFIAEQVSHHPPISAFYAEHHNKRISLDGYIWTKSKFLGLSIGVHMIGQGVITVMDHEEDYIITFPNGYGRSILTVPWVELGGKVTCTCAKTGYSANIEFHTKPFYGGKKDKVTAEIFAPGEKKSFCTIQGEWNGIMWAKYDNGLNECFLDTKNMPIIKKRVQCLEKQDEYESRRLWKDVTYNLKMKDVELATAGKRKLEQRQREEAKDRLARGVKWDTKHFHEVGEHWLYDRSLVKRNVKIC